MFVILSLLSSDAARADLSILNPTSEKPSAETRRGFELPQNLGFIEEQRLTGKSPEAPFVIILQTLHGHYETALKIRGITRYLHEHYGIDTLAAEGASGDLHPEFLRFAKENEANEKALDALARRGEAAGADLAALEGITRARGAEEPEHYRKSYEIFKSVMSRQSLSEAALEAEKMKLDRRASKVLSPGLREILARWGKFSSGRSELVSALELLRSKAPEVLGVDFETAFAQFDWPQVSRLVLLQELSRKNSAEVWASERKLLEGALQASGLGLSFLGFLESGHGSGDARDFMEDFAAKAHAADFQLKNFPQAVYRAAALVIESEIDSRLLYGEMEKLFDRVFAESARTEEEKSLMESYRRLLLAGKLSRLELTPQEWSLWKSFQSPAAGYAEELAAVLKDGESFYGSLEAREQAFLDSVESAAASAPNRSVLFITGGYHAREMMDRFDAQGFRTLLISPHIGGELDNRIYQSIMMRGATLEQTLLANDPAASVRQGWNVAAQQKAVRQILRDEGIAVDADAPYFSGSVQGTDRSELRTDSDESVRENTKDLDGPSSRTRSDLVLESAELDIASLFPVSLRDQPLDQIVFISDNTGTMVENYGEPLAGSILSDAAFLLSSGRASVVINSGDPLRDLSAKTYKPLIESLVPEMRTRFHIVADGGSRRIGFKEDGSARYLEELESWPKERRFAYARVLADGFYKELKKRKGRLAEGLKDVTDEQIDRIREERMKALEALGPQGWGERKPDEAKFMFDLMPENFQTGWGRIFVYDVGPKVSLDAPAIRDYLPPDFMPGVMEEVQKTYPEGTDDLYVVSVPGAVDMARVSKVQGVEKTLAAEVYPKLDAARPVLMVVIGDGDNDIPTFSLKSPEGLPAAVVPVFLRDSANYAGRLPEPTWIGAFKLAGTAEVLRHLAAHAGRKISDIPPLPLRRWARSELRSPEMFQPEPDGRLPGLDLYEKIFSRAPDTRVRVGRDIAHTGALQAASILKALQMKLRAYDAEGKTDRDAAIIFATGNTQWLGLTTLAAMLESWGSWDEETRSLLESMGVDLTDKPDMGRVFATHLDTIFPQSRNDYYSYANELHSMFDKLGISREKRRMFYGDVKNGAIEPGADNQMSPEAFALVEASVDAEGLRLADYLAGQLPADHAQYAYLEAVNQYTKNMAAFVLEMGPDIALFSAGPSYEGKGHIAFNEAGTPFDQGLVMALLSYHAAAGNIKDRGGMQHFRTKEGAVKIGGATLGPKEIRSNHPIFITIINGKEKRESVRSLVERNASPEYPVTALQEGAPGSTVIMESASGSTLRFFTNPWDFREIPSPLWTSALRARFFTQLSKDTGKPVRSLTVDDFLQGTGRENEELRILRTANLIHLTRFQPWEVLRGEVVRTLEKDPLKPEDVPARLGLRAGDSIVHIGPHLDDLSLAAQFLVTEFSKQGHGLSSYYTAPGYTAVSDEYALSALDTLKDFSQAELEQLAAESASDEAFRRNEEKLLRELIEVLASRDLAYDPMNYDTWSLMPAAEQKLRAKLLYLRLNFGSALKDQLLTPERTKALREALEVYVKAKPRWGSSEITVMQKIKVALRFAEEQTELMSRGVAYQEIFFPFQSSWYALERKGTARQSDIEVIKDVIRTRKPRMVIVNGEGFMDHGAHSITEMTVKVAVKELYEEAALPDGFRMFFYRGVWDRAEITGMPDQILVALGEDELNENKSSFVRNYPSQAPALVPDASVKQPMFFSDQVVTNARETLAEWALLNGRPTDDPALQGILAFDMMDFNSRTAVESFLAEVAAKKAELDRVQVPINRASLSKIIGSAPPYADLSGKTGERFLSLLASAGFPYEQILTKEEAEKTRVLDRTDRSELRIQGALRPLEQLQWKIEDGPEIIRHFRGLLARYGYPLPRPITRDGGEMTDGRGGVRYAVKPFTYENLEAFRSLDVYGRGLSPSGLYSALADALFVASVIPEGWENPKPFYDFFGIQPKGTVWFLQAEALNPQSALMKSIREKAASGQTHFKVLVHGAWNGEEAYSTAIALRENFLGLTFEVHARDFLAPDPEALNWTTDRSIPDFLKDRISVYFDTDEAVEPRSASSPAAFKVLRLKPEWKGLVSSFSKGDIREAAFLDSQADLITASRVLGKARYVSNPDEIRTALDHIYQSLKPGGLFLFSGEQDVENTLIRDPAGRWAPVEGQENLYVKVQRRSELRPILIQNWDEAVQLLNQSPQISIRDLVPDAERLQHAYRGVSGEAAFGDTLKSRAVRPDPRKSGNTGWWEQGQLFRPLFWATEGGKTGITGIIYEVPLGTMDTKYPGTLKPERPVSLSDVSRVWAVRVEAGDDFYENRIRAVEVLLPGMTGRSELRADSKFSVLRESSPEVDALKVPFLAELTGREEFDAALLSAGLADTAWDRRTMADYRRVLSAAIDVHYRTEDGVSLESRIAAIQQTVTENKQPLAVFVRMEDLTNEEKISQVLETAVFLTGVNKTLSHYVVLTVDREDQTEPLRERVTALLHEKFPDDAGRRNQIYARLPVTTASRTAAETVVPRGALAAWVDWDTAARLQEQIPAFARERQIRADRLANGETLTFDGRNRGFGTALLQAALLLLQGEEASGLQPSRGGFYVQTGRGILAGISQMLKALQTISKAA